MGLMRIHSHGGGPCDGALNGAVMMPYQHSRAGDLLALSQSEAVS